MTIRILQHEKPETRTYTTPDLILIQARDSEFAIRVIDGKIEFLGWDSDCAEYNKRGFYSIQMRGIDVGELEEMLEVYRNRGT